MKTNVYFDQENGKMVTEVNTFAPVTKVYNDGRKARLFVNVNAVLAYEEAPADVVTEGVKTWIYMSDEWTFDVTETVEELDELFTARTETEIGI